MLKGQITVFELLEGITEKQSKIITINDFEDSLEITDIISIMYEGMIIDCDSILIEKNSNSVIKDFNVIFRLNNKFVCSLSMMKKFKLHISYSPSLGNRYLTIKREVIL